MLHLLRSILMLILISQNVQGYDPFQGLYPVPNCTKGRRITGCNETLLQAYKRTEASKTDRNMNDANTRMFLYTRCNKKYPEFLHECGGRLPRNTVYKATRNTVFIVGAHMSSICNFAFLREMKDQLLVRDSFNVIIVDWYWGDGLDVYPTPINSEVVGKQIAFVIQNIMKETGVSGDRFHIIGHAQGAHAAGVAGYHLRETPIRRITGLDPVHTPYSRLPPSKKLDSSDAKLVDVIHSSMGECFFVSLGTMEKSGHADFYPNGGRIQLSSIPFTVESALKGDIFQAILCLYLPGCSSFQSTRYFLASINPCHCQFVGVGCSSYDEFRSGKCRSCEKDGSNCAVMGMDFEIYWRGAGNGNGSYYLDTDILCPYCNNDRIDTQGFPKHPNGKNKLHCFNPAATN